MLTRNGSLGKPRHKAAKPARKPGRPSSYTEEVALRICEELSLGNSLRKICQAPDMPNRATVFRWLETRAEFRDQYARARELQADTYADEILDIADNAEDLNRARLQIDARKWAAAKLRPSRYGDKPTHEPKREPPTGTSNAARDHLAELGKRFARLRVIDTGSH